ncbi:MAG: RDD family protein [Planctomycetaceae bacterium]|nr:RDD family protein [Planctomycetaceae bacterium]
MQKHRNVDQLDTSIRIITPENIAFTYQLASIARRMTAYLIDSLIIIALLALFGIFLALTAAYLYVPSGFASGIFLAVTFLMTWFWGGFWETVWNGQTFGKYLMGIRVLTIEGQPINSFQAIVRNIMRIIDLQPFVFSSVAFFVILRTRHFQRFGDLVCGTMVVVDDAKSGRELIRFKHPDIYRVAERIPPGVSLSAEIVKALALYIHRRKSISPRRREHIASIFADLLIARHDLPANVHPDLLLCALYHTHFCLQKDKNHSQ